MASLADNTDTAVLDPAEGYRRWAPHYERETAISFLEDGLVRAMSPSQAGKRLLDAGCGTGRRLLASNARYGFGVEPAPAMLAARIGPVRADRKFIVGDVRQLPVADAAFDEAWCRLVLGHLDRIDLAYRELARAVVPGGRVLISDFHAAAHAAGHRRTFRDDTGVHEIAHHVHDDAAHLAAAKNAGLRMIACNEGVIGPLVRHFYEQAGRLSAYPGHCGLPVVIAWCFVRDVTPCAG